MKEATKKGTKQTKRKAKQKPVPKKQKKIFWQKNKVIILVVGIIAIVAVVAALVFAVLLPNLRNSAIEEYNVLVSENGEVSYDFGYALGSLAAEEGIYSEENNTDELYKDLATRCLDHLGYDGKYIYEYLVYKDIEKGNFSTGEIQQMVKETREINEKIKKATEDVKECRSALKKYREEKDAEAKEKAKAEEEKKAKERAAEEEKRKTAERVAKWDLTYDKFTNQIYEGMTLAQLKEVYGGFDTQCTLSTSSTNYEFYSCKISTSSYKTASFAFRNGKLTYKSQYGLK